jgi:hypothetical protein
MRFALCSKLLADGLVAHPGSALSPSGTAVRFPGIRAKIVNSCTRDGCIGLHRTPLERLLCQSGHVGRIDGMSDRFSFWTLRPQGMKRFAAGDPLGLPEFRWR